MLIKVNSVSFSGLTTLKIDVEVNIAEKGLPSFDIVGLPNKAVAGEQGKGTNSNKQFRDTFPFQKDYSKSCARGYSEGGGHFMTCLLLQESFHI